MDALTGKARLNNETPYFKIKHPFSSWDCWESLAFAYVVLSQDQLPLQCPKQFCEEVEVNHVRCTLSQPHPQTKHPQTKEWVCSILFNRFLNHFCSWSTIIIFFYIKYITYIYVYIYIFFFLKIVTKIWVQLSFKYSLILSTLFLFSIFLPTKNVKRFVLFQSH